MTVGVAAPRVVVRPPHVPAPPPISLFTQNNVVEDDSDLIGPSDAGRWEGGGGTIWQNPLTGFLSGQPRLWQTWPSGGGAASSVKGTTSDAFTSAASSQSPVQFPMVATAFIESGLLADWAVRNQPEGDVSTQLQRLLGALLPATVQHELWTSATANTAAWDGQCRLKTATSVASPSVVPLARALAWAEGYAGNNFLDRFGGAMIHVSPTLFSLLTTESHGLVRSPTGRQVMTMSGCTLIPEGHSTQGTWPENGGHSVNATPAAGALDDKTGGWMFVTPPIRVRLGQGAARLLQGYDLTGAFDSAADFRNNEVYVVERAFTLEYFNDSATTVTSYAIPVDYTTLF